MSKGIEVPIGFDLHARRARTNFSGYISSLDSLCWPRTRSRRVKPAKADDFYSNCDYRRKKKSIIHDSGPKKAIDILIAAPYRVRSRLLDSVLTVRKEVDF